MSSESSFIDEWAYLSQTSYADLWFAGDHDSGAWLEYPAYDLPPLPKYVSGLALSVAGYRRPGLEAAWHWYRDTHYECGGQGMRDAARWPVVAFGAMGCVAIYALGVMCGGRRVGFLAALLLMINPLYSLHARRAMSDVVAESLILVAAAAFLWVWRRTLAGRPLAWSALGAAGAGIAGGLAALAKLNGALAMLVIITWAILAFALWRFARSRRLVIAGATVLAGVLSLATFIALNPFVTAQPRRPDPAAIGRLSPIERLIFLVKHRVGIAKGQQAIPKFQRDALTTLQDKLATVVVQGFGRFGPFGPRHANSEIRYERAQDWGAAVWLPLVIAGAGLCWLRGRRQLEDGEPPTSWAILLQAAVSLVVVTAYLPLAWDRYYLSLQPGSALLGTMALVGAIDYLQRSLTHPAREA